MWTRKQHSRFSYDFNAGFVVPFNKKFQFVTSITTSQFLTAHWRCAWSPMGYLFAKMSSCNLPVSFAESWRCLLKFPEIWTNWHKLWALVLTTSHLLSLFQTTSLTNECTSLWSLLEPKLSFMRLKERQRILHTHAIWATSCLCSTYTCNVTVKTWIAVCVRAWPSAGKHVTDEHMDDLHKRTICGHRWEISHFQDTWVFFGRLRSRVTEQQMFSQKLQHGFKTQRMTRLINLQCQWG